MGKSKRNNRQYITQKEWTHEHGGFKGRVVGQGDIKTLPFFCCSLALTPFENPVCGPAPDYSIFDAGNIIPYIKIHHRNPVTGLPLEESELWTLHFTKQPGVEDSYQCPVTLKVFTEYSHIVAIRTSGWVYSFEAIDNICLQPNNMICIQTDIPFAREDIITLQDPRNVDARDMTSFLHLRQKRARIEGTEIPQPSSSDGTAPTSTASTTTSATSTARARVKQRTAIPPPPQPPPKKQRIPVDTFANGIVPDALASGGKSTAEFGLCTHHRAASLTCSSAELTTHSREIVPEQIRKVKKKGYVKLVTTHGDLNLELHCDLVPKTCMNFIGLCDKGYYNGTIFHRSIKNFMIQGGDPTGTGSGGESLWGAPFKDEFTQKLTHTGRGVVSMANSGPNSNKSQFFITFKSCEHLNHKHSIFGRVVGGIEVLQQLERIPTNSKDRPTEEIRILRTVTYADPFSEPEPHVLTEEEIADQEQRGLWFSAPLTRESAPRVVRDGVGKYIDSARDPKPMEVDRSGGAPPPSSSSSTTTTAAASSASRIPPPPAPAQTKPRLQARPSTQLFDFSGW